MTNEPSDFRRRWLARAVTLALVMVGCSDPDLSLRVVAPPGVADPTVDRPANDPSPFEPGDRVDVGAADLALTGAGRTVIGNTVSMPGDVDGDGRADVLISNNQLPGAVSCVGDDCLYLSRGGVQIAFGSADLRAARLGRTALLRGWSQAIDAVRPSAAGDVDGDGRADFLVPLPPALQCDPGSAALVYGSPMSGASELQDVASVVRDEELCTVLGSAATGLGDIDGDGFDDFAVAAPGYELINTTGRLYVFYGGPARAAGRVSAPLDGDARFVTAARDTGFGFPHAVGDTDGDGRDDFIVSSSHPVSGASGGAFLVLGRDERFTGTIEVEDVGIPITAPEGWVRPAERPIGDLDGDGRDELAFHTDVADPSRDVTVIYGRPEWPASLEIAPEADFWLASGPDAPHCESLVGAGDFDGDGQADVLCGAPDHRNGAAILLLGSAHRHSGAIALLAHGVTFLGRDVSDTLGAHGDGSSAGDRAGTSVAGGADVDGDGLDDIVIGAPGPVAGDDHAGAVFVFLGRS